MDTGIGAVKFTEKVAGIGVLGTVLVIAASKGLVEDEMAVASWVVIVVETSCEPFAVILPKTCSGHIWNDWVMLFQNRSSSNRLYPMSNNSEIAVRLLSEYCRVQNHDDVKFIPGRRICEIGMSREISRWTRRAACNVGSGYWRSPYGPKELRYQFKR